MIHSTESFHPNPDNLRAIQDVGRQVAPDTSELAKWCSGFIAGNSLRISYDLELVQRFANKSGLILDVGAIPPLLITALKRQGYNVAGLDIDPSRFSDTIGKLDIDVRACNVETESIPYEDNSIDLMVFNELFEHLRINLIATFEELWRVLKPGGIILMSTPNGLAMHSLVRMLQRREVGPGIHFEYEKLTRVGHMGHVREYSVNEVVEFLERMNFEVVEVVHRARYHRRWIDVVLRLFPSMRPFLSFVIRKPA
jgi:SAM-dependent methyltransferase